MKRNVDDNSAWDWLFHVKVSPIGSTTSVLLYGVVYHALQRSCGAVTLYKEEGTGNNRYRKREAVIGMIRPASMN